MKLLHLLASWIDRLNKGAGVFAGWISLIMVLVVFTDVVLRYAFSMTSVFVQELEWHLFSILFLSGAGYTLLRNGHVRVDVFYQRFSPRGAAWVNLLGVIFFLLPACIMVVDTSWVFSANSFALNEGSPNPGGIPARYLLKFFIPFGFSLLFLQGVSLGIKSVSTIIGRPYPEGGEEAE